MNATMRNLAVGVVVLAGLAGLGWLILLFGGSPQALQKTYRLKIWFESAGPISEGADVRVSGVLVGRVTDIKPQEDFTRGVVVYTDIDWDYRIPADCQPVIRPAAMGLGKPSVEILVQSRIGPAVKVQGEPAFLPRDGNAQITGKLLTGFEGLFPEATESKLSELAKSLNQIVDALNELLEPRPVAEIDAPTTQGERARMANVSTVVQRLDTSLRHVNRLLAEADENDLGELLGNLRETSENVKTFSQGLGGLLAKANAVADSAQGAVAAAEGTFKTADAELKRVSTAIVDHSRKMAAAMDQLTMAMEKVNAGKGTAGKLINDPGLYDELLLATDRLNKTIAELQQLVRQWQAEGVKIKLN